MSILMPSLGYFGIFGKSKCKARFSSGPGVKQPTTIKKIKAHVLPRRRKRSRLNSEQRQTENIDTMSVQSRYPYEGLLHKYTNAMKGWQYRWFILSPETGELHYFLSESEKNHKPRCSIYLAGAVIAPSDEDSNTFTVNSATGDMIKLRASDARARQEWVDKLRAVTEIYTRAIASSHPPLPPRDHSNASRSSVAKLDILDAFANCREQINKAEKQRIALAQAIESSSSPLDPELLTLKATAHATLHTLNQCLSILYQ